MESRGEVMRGKNLFALSAAGLSIALALAACSSGNGGNGGSGGTGGTVSDDPVAAGFAGFAEAADAIIASSESLQSLAALAPEILAAFDAAPANGAIQPKQETPRPCIRSGLGGAWEYTEGQGFARTSQGNDLTVELPQVDELGTPLDPISIVGRLTVTCEIKGTLANRPDITMTLEEGTAPNAVEAVRFTFRDSMPGETASFDRSLFDTMNQPTGFDLGASVTTGAGGTGGRTSGLNGTVREVGGSVLLELRVVLVGDRNATEEPWTYRESLGEIQGLETLDSRLADLEGSVARQDIQCLRSDVNPPFGIGAGLDGDNPDWNASVILVVAGDGTFESINPGTTGEGIAPLQCEDDGAVCDNSSTIACFTGERLDMPNNYRDPTVRSADSELLAGCDLSGGLFPPLPKPPEDLALYKAGYLGALAFVESLSPVGIIGLSAVLPPSPPCP